MQATPPLAVRIGQLSFDHLAYDPEGDVLYLHVGEPRSAPEAEEIPEGHVLRYDQEGAILGLTLLNAQW